jgi:hypothetical protein
MKCLAHQHNLAALPKLFEARSEIAFCEFESSQPGQPVRSPPVNMRKPRDGIPARHLVLTKVSFSLAFPVDCPFSILVFQRLLEACEEYGLAPGIASPVFFTNSSNADGHVSVLPWRDFPSIAPYRARLWGARLSPRQPGV